MELLNVINVGETNNDGNNGENQENHMVNSIKTNNTSKSTYLKIDIENETVYALVDTGATISVINNELAVQLIKIDQEIPILPVKNVQISNVVDGRYAKY